MLPVRSWGQDALRKLFQTPPLPRPLLRHLATFPGNSTILRRGGVCSHRATISRMTARMYSTAAILALFVSCICNAQQPAKLRISGDGIQPLEITATDLARMPRLTLDVRDPHTGNVHQYGGVRLSDLLTKAGAPLGDKLRGTAVSTCVLARAKDGYAVVYSLAELDPAMNDNQIIVADTTDVLLKRHPDRVP